MKTGLAGFDAVMGNLGLGDLFCVAGRPSVGKTLLLLDVALRIHRRYETNVVFATAREFPEEIIAKAPAAARPFLVELPARDILRGDVDMPAGRGPCVYLVDVHAVGPTRPHYIAHRLNAEHSSRCDLLVSDGWTVHPDRVTYMKRVMAGVQYRLNCERAAMVLPSSALTDAKKFAAASGVATIYGIRTVWHDDQETGPRAEDLLRLRPAVGKSVSRTVMVHRPELYQPHVPGRKVNVGLIELTVADGSERSSRRAELRYDAAARTLRAPARRR